MFAPSNPPPHHHHHPHHPHPPPHHYSLKLKSMFELAVAQQQQYLYPPQQQQQQSAPQYPPPAQPPPPPSSSQCTRNSPGTMEEIPLGYPTSPQTPENLQKFRQVQDEGDDRSQSPQGSGGGTQFQFIGATGSGHGSGQNLVSAQQSQMSRVKNSKGPAAFSIESLLAHSNNWRRQAEENPSTVGGPAKTSKEGRFAPYPQTQQTGTSGTQKSGGKGESKEGAQKGSENSSGVKGTTPGGTTNSARRAAKSKRVRTIFTPEQLERLEAEFERQQYMVGPERLYLASSLYLTEAQVKVWFQNRRIKWRKQHLEMEQQRLAIYRTLAEQDMLASSSSTTPGGCSTSTTNPATLLDDDIDEETSSSRGTADMESVVGDEDDSRDYEESTEDPLKIQGHSPPQPPSARLRAPLHLNNTEDYSDESSPYIPALASQQQQLSPAQFHGVRRGESSTPVKK